MEDIRVYHICVSCKNGLMFRSRQDYIRFINNMAILAHKYRIRILAYAVMSNHYHIGVMADDAGRFLKSLRTGYSNYFRQKYKSGLPKVSCKVQETFGNLHIVTVLSYILRNPVHHGIVGHPFAYPYSSASCYFAYPDMLYSMGNAPALMRSGTVVPDGYGSDGEGMFNPRLIVDVRMTENLFVSSGRFMYFMSRYSGPKWEHEQTEDRASVEPVTLVSVEGEEADTDMFLKYERGHGRLLVPDQILCEWVEKETAERFGKESFAMLDWKERQALSDTMRYRWKVSEEQAVRCLYCEEVRV